MTRREALHIAVQAIQSRPQTKTSMKAIELLQNIEKEVCRRAWTRETILEAFEDWYHLTGSPPTVNNLIADSLPSRFIVERVFGQKAATVLQNAFPDSVYTRRCCRKYSTYTEEQLIAFFREQLLQIKPTSGREYNSQRLQGSPVWETGARRLGCRSWKEFYIRILGEGEYTFSTYNCKILKVEVTSPLAESFAQYLSDSNTRR